MAVRVHELAREFRVETKTVLAVLTEHGFFVKSASSTVEAPAVRLLETHFAAIREGKQPPTPPTAGRAFRAIAEPQPRRPLPTRRRAEMSLEEEVAVLKQKSQRGKRHKGAIDAATQQTLESRDAHDPPFMDEYESARAETNEWLDLGWIAPEEIVRWRFECPGITAEAGMAFHDAAISPRLARTRWNGARLDPEGDFTLYSSMAAPSIFGRPGRPNLTFDDACWLLRKAGLLAS